jgi:hypothetical protein
MAAPIAAAAAADIATKNPKMAVGVVVGGVILVVLILGGVGFAYYKFGQQVGLFGDKHDRLAKERMQYFAKWQGFNPNYYLKYFNGQTTLPKQAAMIAKDIENGLGYFNDDESQVYAAMESIGSAQNLSAVAKAYQSSFNKSLRDDMIEHLGNNEEQDKLIRIVRNYPDFKESDKRTK